MEISKALANLFILACLVGAVWLIWYIQNLNTKIRDLRRKEMLDDVDKEMQKHIQEINATPLGDLIRRANERFKGSRRPPDNKGE